MQPPFVPSNPGDHATEQPPPVLLYYRLYAGFMVALYVLCVLAGAFLIVAGPAPSRSREMPPGVMGAIFVVVGVPLAIAFGVGVLGGRAKWRHTYGLVLIAIGMTSACCLPAALPLLIYWMKPEMKAWFNA